MGSAPCGCNRAVSKCYHEHKEKNGESGVQMSMKLTADEIAEIQKRYHYLVNYEAEDPNSPIDPLTYRDSSGDCLLHIAARLGDIRTIQLLIEGGQDVNATGDMGRTALHNARDKKNDAIANYLLAHGASTNIIDDFGHLP